MWYQNSLGNATDLTNAIYYKLKYQHKKSEKVSIIYIIATLDLPNSSILESIEIEALVTDKQSLGSVFIKWLIRNSIQEKGKLKTWEDFELKLIYDTLKI